MIFTLFLQKKYLMRIVLIGTGNVATHLGLALRTKNAEIIQVFGRTEENAARLGALLGSPWTTSKKLLADDADLYILAVSDDAIPDVASNLSIRDQLIVHTAGSVPMEILASVSKNYGVFYPLQTLSRQKEVDFSQIPVCIEANSSGNLEILEALARTISGQVVRADSFQRRHLHLVAVFVCNFVNHFYSIGEELLMEQQLDFDLLKPLIMETAGKAMQFSPSAVQTGPAVRGSKTVMESHLEMLKLHPEWQRLYELISADIAERRPDDGKTERRSDGETERRNDWTTGRLEDSGTED